MLPPLPGDAASSPVVSSMVKLLPLLPLVELPVQQVMDRPLTTHHATESSVAFMYTHGDVAVVDGPVFNDV